LLEHRIAIGVSLDGGQETRYYPDRYRAGAGFLNISVYCPDLFKLISHIRSRVLTDLDRLLERPA
jgi:hypothetical protein